MKLKKIKKNKIENKTKFNIRKKNIIPINY